MSTRQVVLCHPVRTAIGTYGGSLKDMPAPDLGAVGDPRNTQALRPRRRQDRRPW